MRTFVVKEDGSVDVVDEHQAYRDSPVTNEVVLTLSAEDLDHLGQALTEAHEATQPVQTPASSTTEPPPEPVQPPVEPPVTPAQGEGSSGA